MIATNHNVMIDVIQSGCVACKQTMKIFVRTVVIFCQKNVLQ